MAGAFPEGHVHQLRGADLLIAMRALGLTHVLLDHLVQGPAIRVPEHHARGFFLGVKQSQFLADPAVVALLRLLNTGEILLQLLFVGPGGAVDTLQHLVAGVAAPVGACDLGQLEGLELAGAGHVGAAAEIHPGALLVDGELLALGQVLDNLYLVVLAHVAEQFDGALAAHDQALHCQVVLDDLLHALLDLLQIFRGEVVATGEVVIEAVLDHRTDRHLGTGKQLLHRHRQQVGGGVTNDLQTSVVALGDDRQTGVLLNDMRGVHLATVDHPGQGGLGEAGANGGGHLVHGNGLVKVALTAVRQGNRGHALSLCQWWPLPKAT